MARKFALGKAPFQRITDERRLSTSQMMRDFMIALLPLILFGWVKNGLLPFLNEDPLLKISVFEMLYPLIMVAAGALTSLASEALFFYVTKRARTWAELKHEFSLSYTVIPGILLAMILPIYTPVWVLILGTVFANIVIKMLFGGFGYNILNPALMGYVFIATAFITVITSSVNGGYLLPAELISKATPMQNMVGNVGGTYDQLVKPFGTLWNFLIGTRPGALAETSAILCILAFVYLVARRVIVWIIPVIYVGTVFVLTLIIGLINGQGLWFPVYNVLTGGLLFGAVFMATEPVTSPKSPNGKVIYAFLLGVLTTLFRLSGVYPEGVATSILFMNLFVVIIDRFAATARASVKRRPVIIKYVAISLFIALLAFYTVYRVTTDVHEAREGSGEDLAYAPIVEVFE